MPDQPQSGSNAQQERWTAAERADQELEPKWERDLVTRLASAAQVEQRRARRWGIFFKLLGFIYLIALLVILSGYDFAVEELESGKHTAVVEVEGVIAPGEQADAKKIIKGLQEAFEDGDTAGVILRINSPGGTPVQAGVIYGEILRLRKKYPDKPLYAVIEDICASGAYYLAAAADKIYADKASIIGSIGVRMDGFGFVEALEKLGIERRLLVAGQNKALLDPFSPTSPDQVQHVQQLLDEIHQQFIDSVKKGRGDRLVDDPAIFSGLIWTGEQSLEKGLVDELASADYVAREVIGEERSKNFTPREDLMSRFLDRIGARVLNALQTRLQGVALRP